MNWLLVGVGIIFLLCIVVGIARGFIRIVVSLVATVVTIVLVIFLTPYTGKLITKLTPIDNMVQNKCVKAMTPDIKDVDMSGISIDGVDLSGLDLENSGISAEDIQKALGSIEIPLDAQIKAINHAEIPGFLKEGLLSNNNKEAYKELGATSFPEYVGAYLAKIIVNIVAFLLTFLLVTLVVRIIMYALGIIGELPILHGINRLAGGVLGMGTGLVIVWVAFMVITLLYTTDIGKDCFVWIQESQLLSFLYNNNPIMKWVTAFR